MMMRLSIGRLLLACMLAVAGTASAAADGIVSKPVQFAKGKTSTTLKGSLKGDRIIDYKLRAKAGQTMNVAMKASNGSAYFNVLPPGSSDEAIFVGSRDGNEWSGALPTDGEYTVRVYLMRNAARRNESTTYTLTVGITNGAGAATAGDAKVKGTPYNATGPLECSMGNAPSKCEFGVMRSKPGNAEVHVKPAGGLERVLTFSGNKVTSGTDKVIASKSGDMWNVEVNDFERYKIPEAVISGG